MSYKWYIIYPAGDRNKIKVYDILDDEVDDYALASRQSFLEYNDAASYAKKLSKEHDKIFVSNEKHDHLD